MDPSPSAVEGRYRHRPTIYDHMMANCGKRVPWWDYFQIFVYPDRAEVYEEGCDRTEPYESLAKAIDWVTENARERIARDVMET
jgi:hypothetical protein